MEIEYREPRISFIKLGDETIRKIISYTGGNYDCKGDFVCAEDIDVIIEDLLIELECKDAKINDLKNQLNNDFNPDLEIPEIHGKRISY